MNRRFWIGLVGAFGVASAQRREYKNLAEAQDEYDKKQREAGRREKG